MNDESEKEHGDEPNNEKEAEDNGAETGGKSKAEDDGAEAEKKSNTEDDGSAKATRKSKEEDAVAEAQKQSKTEDDGSAKARRKSKEEDDVSEAGKQSKTEDDGSAKARRKSKEEDDVSEAGKQSKTEDDGSAKARRKSKEEDDVSEAGKQSKTEDDGSAKERRKSKEEDDVAEARKQSKTEDDGSAKARRKSKEEDDVAEAIKNRKVEGETQEKTTLTYDKNGACTCPKPPPPKPKLYITEPSAPVRSVLITAAAIGLELDKQEVDLLNGEHLTLNFLKLNPQHTVPTLVDGDYVLWDSHAINPYLIGKYAENSTLYPKDLQKRAIVDNRLHYNNSTIFNAYKHILTSVLFKGSPVTADHIKNLEEIYGLLNTFLEKTKFIAGDDLTIADFSVIPHITTVEILVPIDEDKFPRLIEWKGRVKELPCCAANEPGLRKFKEIIKNKLNN